MSPPRWPLSVVPSLLRAALRRPQAPPSGAAGAEDVESDTEAAALRQRIRALEEALRQLQSRDGARTRFFADIAHELRTPLTLTIGPLEDLHPLLLGNDRALRWHDLAMRNARRVLRLVHQLLDVARLEAGEVRLTPRRFDVSPFVRAIVDAFAPVAERKGIGLSVSAPASLDAILDSDALEKIVTNLLSNALQFTDGGGEVHVTLSNAEGGRVHLAVCDTGVGISAAELPRVFDRFFRGEGGEGRPQTGTGIGLSLVQELVKLHGGTIGVTSGPEGSTFAAELPGGSSVVEFPDTFVETMIVVVRTEEAACASSSGARAAVREADDSLDAQAPRGAGALVALRGRPTVLLVDDSDDLRSYVRGHLSSSFHVLEGGDGATGIALAQRHAPDVVVTDVAMPGVEGLSLIRALRSHATMFAIPILVLSALADADHRLSALEQGADDFMAKPFDMRELELRVRNLAGRRARSVAYGEAPVAYASERGTRDAPEFLEQVRRVVLAQLGNADFSVTELAAAVGLERSYLFRRVKRLTGETPSSLMQRIRLEEAELLLQHGTRTVADVAFAVGFGSVSYFCRCFRTRYGATPAVYRRSFDA